MESTCPRCPLINTSRLKPIRQRVNRIIMTLLDSGHVSLEILGHLNNQPDGPEIAKELFHVFPDGKRIEVYQSLEGVAAIEGCPVSSQPDKIFIYPDMPEKQWKMYQHAYKFIDVIKSKTAKVVLMTDRARCMLMENLPIQNFQASFNDGVTILLTDSKVTITETDGSSISFDKTLTSNYIKATAIEKMEYMKKCHLQCLDIQDSVSRLQSNESKQDLFPLTVGTKTAPFKLTSQPSDAQKLFHQSAPKLFHQSAESLHSNPSDIQGSDNQKNFVQLGHMQPVKGGPETACSSSSSSSSKNTSWCHNKGGDVKLDDKHNKSDSGCFSMTSKGPFLPLSPQKQFLMSEVDRCRVDLTRPPHLHNSLDMSVSSYYSDSPSSSSGCDPIRQVFVPYTGWASFYATGAVWILYNDGTQLGIKSTEATMTYIDQDGCQKRYKNSDVIPEIIKIKLEKLPMVIDLLMKSPPISSSLY